MRAICYPCAAVPLRSWVENANSNLVDAEGLLVLLFQWTWVFLTLQRHRKTHHCKSKALTIFICIGSSSKGGGGAQNSELETYKALVCLTKEKKLQFKIEAGTESTE